MYGQNRFINQPTNQMPWYDQGTMEYTNQRAGFRNNRVNMQARYLDK